MTINPTLAMYINIALAALTGIGTMTATDPMTQKVISLSGVAAFVLNTAAHAFSSPAAGPLAKVTPPPKKP